MLLSGYAVLASFAYGVIMDLWFWPFGTGYGTGLSFVAGDPVADNVRRFLAFHLATSMGWDVARAVTLVVMMVVLGRPVLAALRRTSQRAAFDHRATFESAP